MHILGGRREPVNETASRSPVSSVRRRRRRRGRGLLGIVLVIGLFAIGGCGTERTREVPEVRSLFSKVDEEEVRRYPHLVVRYRERLCSREVLGLGFGQSLILRDLDLPKGAQFSFEFRTLGEPGFALEELSIELRGFPREGPSVLPKSVLIEGGEEGRMMSRCEFDFGSTQKIDRCSITFLSRGKETSPASRIVWAKPKARYRRSLRVAKSETRPRQVLLITLDTLRADHLGCYGNGEVSTPSLDRVAADGVRFANAFSVSNMTNPAHTSIFTSLYLKDHGVVDNFLKLSPEAPTLLDVLGDAGFLRAAFTASWNFSPHRLDVETRFDEVYPCRGYHQRRADDVNTDVIPWLNDHAAEDFFAWIHYFDPHMPYDPPYPYNQLYTNRGEEKIELPVDYAGQEEWFRATDELEVYKNGYKGEVTFLDHHLGKLFDHLRELEIYDDALIIVVSDHGEGLGERGIYCEHRGLHDEMTRIPFLLKPPSWGPRGSRRSDRISGRIVEDFVSLVDVLPTVASFLESDVPFPIRGRSLRPLLEENRGRLERDRVFSEHSQLKQVSVRTSQYRFLFGLDDQEYFPRFALRKGERELYPVSASEGQGTLEDLESPNLVLDRPEATKEFLEAVRVFLEDRMEFKADPVLDPETIERLKRLGYTPDEKSE